VPYCDSAKTPYVYSQTLPDALRLVATVEALARVSPQGYGTVVEVMSPESYWPLPWYLRRFQNVGYWDKIPDQPPAPIMIVSTDLHAAFDEGPARHISWPATLPCGPKFSWSFTSTPISGCRLTSKRCRRRRIEYKVD
jgi:predicted membrane-bound mannosyltransferase